MSPIRLSYILTTFNKLPYLSVTLPLLIAEKKADEEIVIVDGGSSDGTAAYLQQLLNEKKIDQFISEKDHGEAHGTNKAMLLARGELIKIITDDDVYHYPTIERCKVFMLANPQVDILGMDGIGFSHSSSAYRSIDQSKDYKVWKQYQIPFLFCGLGFMMRRTSLAFMGLFNTNFKIVDIEYAIRVSSMKTNIVFYTGPGYLNIVNPQSNSHKFYQIIAREREMLAKTYPMFKHRITYRGSVIKLKEIITTSLLKKPAGPEVPFNYAKIVAESIERLNDANSGKTFDFLT